MTELIAIIILILSLSGMVIIAFRKIPLLLELPETIPSHFSWQNLFLKIQTGIKSLPLFKRFSVEIILQKILSKVRIITLKTDHKTSNLLQKLRERSQKNKFSEDNNYWQEIKKSTKR